MAAVIRLNRRGAKKSPFYRLVVADSRFQRDGRFIESVGTYNPIAPADKQIVLENDRIEYWLKCGAKPSETVASLLKKKAKKS